MVRAGLGYFLDTWKKQWLLVSEGKMPEFPQQMLEEGIKRLREVGMVQETHHVWLEHPPNDYISQKAVSMLVRGTPASLRNSTLLCRLLVMVGKVITELG